MKKMKNRLNFSLLNGSALYTFGRSFIDLFDLTNMPDGSLKILLNRLVNFLGYFGKGFERENADPNTKIIDQMDALRDQFYNGLKYFVKSFTYSDVDEVSEAAIRIMDVIRRYGFNANNMGYNDQTTATTSFVSEINEKYLSDITLLNATNWFNKLSTAEAQFEESVKNRITEGAVEVPSITRYRPDVVKTLRNVFHCIDSDYEASHDETLKIYIDQIDELISLTMASAKAAATRRANQKAEGVD